MTINHSRNQEIIFGPYGTRIKEIENQKQIPPEETINYPTAVLHSEEARDAIQQVANEYIRAGASVATTNTYGLRNIINQPSSRAEYQQALQLHHQLVRQVVHDAKSKIDLVVSLGPTGDAYIPDKNLRAQEAEDFHSIQAFEAGKLDIAAAWFETVNSSAEALGIARAAKKHNVPCVISFIINKNGELLSGENPAEVVRQVDLETWKYPLGYSFNCCPIEGLEQALSKNPHLHQRILAVYPNASSLDQQELEKLSQVAGVENTQDKANQLYKLAQKWGIKIIGGCCGYNDHDIATISATVHTGLILANCAENSRSNSDKKLNIEQA